MPSCDERPPADFNDDVSNPVNLEAEERALAYVRGVRRWPCLDRRGKHLGWDFELFEGDGMKRWDVKADSYIDETGRVIFEDRHVYDNGLEDDGWGRNPSLDMVAVVGTTSWRCVFVWLPKFRALVEQARPWENVPRGWVPFERANKRGGYQTMGWAVPLDQLLLHMVVRHVAVLPEGKL